MSDTTNTRRPRKMAREPETAVPDETPATSPAPKAPSKAAQVLALLQRPEGASLAQLVAATGWLPHTARAALTGLRKKGHVLSKDKVGWRDPLHDCGGRG